MIKTITVLFFVMLILHSCSSVKEYEKEKINDPDMKLTARTSERYETSFQVYREAAAGANGGKSGGGCGCN
ncbi:DUF4266 domain-containing protein [Flavobacterium glaciei]|uniref:Uncharacterized protein DUF4266 n=1 Tax=Flavobacterium glaciei TaxID=386300 RepID=A0A562PPP8_9FLAO|nr:DUF4266 domain-containing protein [Flavobacterium glaciei]RDI53487.1 uncharacterized protein DUF4266 [Flavobacterium glaciei]TWI46389.1 uncharacterized protein DUF4266 [Flavobacterium glaciei]